MNIKVKKKLSHINFQRSHAIEIASYIPHWIKYQEFKLIWNTINTNKYKEEEKYIDVILCFHITIIFVARVLTLVNIWLLFSLYRCGLSASYTINTCQVDAPAYQAAI